MTSYRRPLTINYTDFSQIDRIRQRRFDKYKRHGQWDGQGGDPPGQGDQLRTFAGEELTTFANGQDLRIFN